MPAFPHGPESKMASPERDRIAVPAIVKLLGILFGAVLVSAGVSGWLLHELGNRVSDNTSLAHANPLPAFAAPRLSSSPRVDIDAYRAEKRAQLESYRWIDRDRGIVAIPIARAMELLAQRGGESKGRAQ
jgi:hypothetical protein